MHKPLNEMLDEMLDRMLLAGDSADEDAEFADHEEGAKSERCRLEQHEEVDAEVGAATDNETPAQSGRG